MKTWLLDALDPLYFGDGRPVEGTAGRGRALPPPQVLAGLVRTRQGLDKNGAWASTPDQARSIAVEGPYPALLAPDGAVEHWCFPRPLDALVIGGALRRLVPLDLSAWGARFDAGAAGLAPVGLPEADPKKPDTMRALWRWAEMASWLTGALPESTDLGVDEPPLETRTHVAIDPATGRALDGKLFSLGGRRMHDKRGQPIAIGLRTSSDKLTAGVGPAGGERRLVRWQASAAELPSIPAAVLTSARAGTVRVVLATPGLFTDGWRPRALFDAPAGSTLAAAAVGRPEVVSGWDLEKKRARPTRRCAPAGSVYFLRLGGSEKERETWARAAWLSPRADADLDRHDGYASLLLGTWDGTLAAPPTPRP